jgi:hypothetical protein
MALLPALAQVAGVLLLFTAAGAVGAMALVPPGSPRAERAAWAFASGLAILAASVPLCLAIGIRPGWTGALVLAGLSAVAGWRARLPAGNSFGGTMAPLRGPARLWLAVLGLGVALYALRALTEPMWSNDFLAIWGLKGKLIFLESRVPERLFTDSSLSATHPEYPLGLPFLYAGLASLLGRWDDHAMALLFPALQVATALALVGWLRRRGAAPTAACAAAALLSLFEPLYAAYITGMADVPLSLFFLLLAAALSDALDDTDPGAVRRLAVAAGLCVATKNEGLFFVIGAILLGTVASRRTGRRAAPILAALLLPTAAVVLAQRLRWGSPPLGDFDFGLLRPSSWGALAERFARTLTLAFREVILPAAPGLFAVLVILFAGRRTRWADRLLVLAALSGLAYLVLPAFAVYPGMPDLGPALLVRTALARTCAALAPLVAAALAGRLAPGAVDAGASAPADPAGSPVA